MISHLLRTRMSLKRAKIKLRKMEKMRPRRRRLCMEARYKNRLNTIFTTKKTTPKTKTSTKETRCTNPTPSPTLHPTSTSILTKTSDKMCMPQPTPSPTHNLTKTSSKASKWISSRITKTTIKNSTLAPSNSNLHSSLRMKTRDSLRISTSTSLVFRLISNSTSALVKWRRMKILIIKFKRGSSRCRTSQDSLRLTFPSETLTSSHRPPSSLRSLQ